MAGVTQSTEESRGPESRSRQQLPSSPGVLGKSRQSCPLLRFLIRTQPKGSQGRKTEVPPKVASSQRHSGCAGPRTFAGLEEQSLGTSLQRDRTMSPLFYLHTLSLSLLVFLCPRVSLPNSQDASSVLPLRPRGGRGRGSILAAHFGSLGLLGGLPGTSGPHSVSLPPPNLTALWKSDGGGTLMVGRPLEVQTTSGKRVSTGWVRENSCVFGQLSWSPEDEGNMETLELGSLAMPPPHPQSGSLGAT